MPASSGSTIGKRRAGPVRYTLGKILEGDPGRLEVRGSCPVRQECLDWSLEQDATLDGIWGGWSKKDRKKWGSRGGPLRRYR
jgi:hypothetical protein